jgi:plastocyanin
MIYRLLLGSLSVYLVASFSGCCGMHHTAACPPATGLSVMQPAAVAAPAATYSAQYGAQYGSRQSVTVGAYDNYFQPATVTIAPGTTVTWANYGRETHTAMANDGRFDSGDIRPGASYSVTFAQPGTYYYHCCHHREMQGTIIVSAGGNAAGGNQGGQMGGY